MFTTQTVMTLGQQALEVMLLIAGPMLVTALLVGLLISVLQAATQVNEMTLSFIPKVLALALVIVVMGPWMLQLMIDYTIRLLQSIPTVIG